MNEINSGIYCIENIINNKKYIGQSKNINERYKKHIYELNNNRHFNDYLQKAWNKYGEESFKMYVIEYCKIDILDEKESYYISYYNTLDQQYGYNLTSGGQLNKGFYTEETCKKISESLKKTYENTELKDIRSKSALRQWANPDIKEKIIGSNNGMYGKHHTKESKEKMSNNKKGKPSWKRNTTPVYCVELNQEFCDATYASKLLNIDSGAILKVCRGKRKICGGYHWKFLN